MSEVDPTFLTPEQALAQLPENVNLHFFFALHGTEKDFEQLPHLIGSCDVYIPEFAAWDEQLLGRYSRIAQGSKIDYQHMRKEMVGIPDEPAKAFELKTIYGSHKKIAMIGFTAEDQAAVNLDWLMKAMRERRWESDQEFLHQERLFAILQEQREEKMLYDLAYNLPPVIAGSKKLAEKPEVNVLLNMGPLHTPVYKRAAAALNTPDHRRVTRSFFEKPVFYPLDVSIYRRHLFGLPTDTESILEDVRRMDQYRSELDGKY
jgi:hypothetical protein